MAGIPDPNTILTRWRAGVSSKSGNYAAGVANGADWAAAATAPAAVNARNAGLQAAIANGSIERGIQKLGTQQYKNITASKAQNWVTGVNSPAAQQNAAAGFAKLVNYLNNAASSIANSPRGGFQENMQRMVAHATSMHDQAQAAKGL